MPATLEAPPAAPAAPAPPAARPTINVSSLPVTGHVEEVKPGSARAGLRAGLAKLAGVETQTPPATPAKPADSPAPAVPPETGDRPGDPPPAEAPAAGDAPPSPAAQPSDRPKGKANPWKLVDEFKAKAVAAEQRALELEKQLLPEPERKAQAERLTRAEARAKELEDEIRYVRYEKSPEFQEKYQKPYQEAWARALNELGELTVTDPGTQQARPIQAGDILDLVNMSLPDARAKAVERFGDFADDVMAHRKEIKKLFEQQAAALTEARTKGAEREQQLKQQVQEAQGQLEKFVRETWEGAQNEILNDPDIGPLFKQDPADPKWNSLLESGYKLVDDAYRADPRDPKLSPEERKLAVRRHAAVRNRAAAWGPLRHKVNTLTAKLAAIEKELAQYKSSTPPAGGAQPAAKGGAPVKARDQVFSALNRLAH
jgi:hypothetical protein